MVSIKLLLMTRLFKKSVSNSKLEVMVKSRKIFVKNNYIESEVGDSLFI